MNVNKSLMLRNIWLTSAIQKNAPELGASFVPSSLEEEEDPGSGLRSAQVHKPL